MSQSIFKVNEYISLKLEKGRTNIYVRDGLFTQCRFLLLNVPLEEMDSWSDVKSIDEAVERLDRSMEQEALEDSLAVGIQEGDSEEENERDLEEETGRKRRIPPEVEFWGHCSNLQAWAENKYDTRLLHSNLSFPLLKKLAEAGDPQARRVFKEEIARRYMNGTKGVREFLEREKYLSLLAREERHNLIESEQDERAIRQLEEVIGRELELDTEYNKMDGSMVINHGRVEELHLWGCKLKEVPQPIANLSASKVLRMNYNELETLPEWIDRLPASLEILDLSDNELTTLPESLGNLKFLKNLNLHKNKLASLPESFGNLKFLESLDLSNNKLVSLPESFGGLDSLKKLSLRENQLKCLPESYWSLKSIENLSLSHNNFESLPESIGRLKSLRFFGAGENSLTELPQSLGELAALERVDFGYNKLKSLPESIGNLRSLEWLALSVNQLIALPESMGKLFSLKELYLDRNQLKSLPKSMGDLTSLKRLSLIESGIRWLPIKLEQASKQNKVEIV